MNIRVTRERLLTDKIQKICLADSFTVTSVLLTCGLRISGRLLTNCSGKLWACGSVLAMESVSSEVDCLGMSGTYKMPEIFNRVTSFKVSSLCPSGCYLASIPPGNPWERKRDVSVLNKASKINVCMLLMARSFQKCVWEIDSEVYY